MSWIARPSNLGVEEVTTQAFWVFQVYPIVRIAEEIVVLQQLPIGRCEIHRDNEWNSVQVDNIRTLPTRRRGHLYWFDSSLKLFLVLDEPPTIPNVV